MRAVTHLYSLFILILFFQEIISIKGRIHCGNALFCFPDKISEEFNHYRKVSKELEEIVNKSKDDNNTHIPMVEGSNLFRTMNEKRKLLCSEMNMAGFLLDENVTNYTTQCMWNGRDYNGKCVPAPVEPGVIFYYFNKKNWADKLKKFRETIGCSKKEILNIGLAEEQYVCRERCMQGGISYAASMIMIVSFCVAFMINCI